MSVEFKFRFFYNLNQNETEICVSDIELRYFYLKSFGGVPLELHNSSTTLKVILQSL